MSNESSHWPSRAYFSFAAHFGGRIVLWFGVFRKYLKTQNSPLIKIKTNSHSKVFQSAFEKMEAIVTPLESPDILGHEHGDVEAFIQKHGTELLRQLLQGFFDLEGLNEERKTVVEAAGGMMLSHCLEDCKRNLMSLFGNVISTRKGYSVKNHSSCFPLDAQLNLNKAVGSTRQSFRILLTPLTYIPVGNCSCVALDCCSRRNSTSPIPGVVPPASMQSYGRLMHWT